MESARATGRVLKIARIANDYTRKEVAELTQLSPNYISEIEHGKKHVGKKSLEKFAKAYNMTFFQLMTLIQFYTKLELDEETRYKLTLLKALEMLLNRWDVLDNRGST